MKQHSFRQGSIWGCLLALGTAMPVWSADNPAPAIPAMAPPVIATPITPVKPDAAPPADMAPAVAAASAAVAAPAVKDAAVADIKPPVPVAANIAGKSPIEEVTKGHDILNMSSPTPDEKHVISSLFFSKSETMAMATAKQQFRDRANITESEDDLLDQLRGIKETQKKEEDFQEKYYAQFYLESIMYHTPNDWVVRVKDATSSKKYEPNSAAAPNDEIKVIAISKEEATFEWKPRNWQYVLSHYKDDLSIRLDKARQMVDFTLRVNETMTAVDMQIKQGVVTVVAVPNAAGGSQPVIPAVPALGGTTPAAPAPAANSANTGGVLGLYKNLEPVDKKP